MGKTTIVSDPEVMMGKPVVTGTRITVEYILEELAHGQTVETLVDSHPTLTREGVLAALEYAARVLRLDVVDPIEASRREPVVLADENVETEVVHQLR